MEAEFWLNCWKNNHLGFQLEQPHPMLVAALPLLPKVPKVFVPLCGKSPDLHFLAEHFMVVGSELSAIACHDFFAEAGLNVIQSAYPEHVLYSHKNLNLWQGDFFTLPQDAIEDISLIYDRAALIALPIELRKQYVQKLRCYLPNATLLLISLEYPQAEKAGPPFSVNEAEIHQLFDGATIEKLTSTDLTGEGFARRRFLTSSLIETSWLISW
jgi:thiopurine S-methyltransferase